MQSYVSDLNYVLPYRNDQGNTPLHLACMRKGNVGIVRELIAAIDSDAGEVNSLLNERYVYSDMITFFIVLRRWIVSTKFQRSYFMLFVTLDFTYI